MSLEYILVEDNASLDKVITKLEKEEVIGWDLEGEFNLHRYGMHLCLLQLSDGKTNYLLDPLKIESLDRFFEFLENPEVQKIAHGPQSDILLLDNIYGRRPKNVFDTQKAATFLNYESTSLNGLLTQHFSIEKDAKLRENDWNMRPLPEKMLVYAAKDVYYLPQLRTSLIDELNEMGRLHWLEEENQLLEELRYSPKENPHLALKGTHTLNDRQTMVLKEIFHTRDSVARRLDKPPGFVINNGHLVDLAASPPHNAHGWRSLRRVHPRLRQFADEFVEAVEKGKNAEIPRKKRDPNRKPGFKYLMRTDEAYRDRYHDRKDRLEKVKEALEAQYELGPMILSNKTIHQIASDSDGLSLRNWQREMILKTAQEEEIQVQEFLDTVNA